MTKRTECGTCKGKGKIGKDSMEVVRYYIKCPECNGGGRKK